MTSARPSSTGRMTKLLEPLVPNPSVGLPEEVFRWVSGITPMVNVDLLIKDRRGRTLLTWRDDGLHPACWHIPGGIVRFKEKMADRIAAVAKKELRTTVRFDPVPVAINELIHPTRQVRGHFISFLYRCRLTGQLPESLHHTAGDPQPDQWAWHPTHPKNLITAHGVYREFM